ncbi:PIG-L deacetylase family protein [Enterocloster bolteae]|uniref:PIG-L deacetylase family protein n=1 Tax=Enterocloster bolteae TaxID=208479 RepID=UPI00210D26ED|nr:PIG-L family deacetylase [Enterocloster bolteae]MCQ5146259.1 PIG-L family deacetylase [Enterocloster bolteae]
MISGIKKKIRLYFIKKGMYGSYRQIEFSESDRILVVSPHPDDESIGCGALIAKYHDNIEILLITNGAKGNPEWDKDTTIKVRCREFSIATKKVSKCHILMLEDSTFSYMDLRRQKFDYTKYNYIFVPNRHESHPDHVKTYRFVCRILRRMNNKARILEYEVWTPLKKFNYFLDFSDYAQQKWNAINCYNSQLKHVDYINKIKGLNCYRGLIVSKKYIECYYMKPNIYEKLFSVAYRLYCKIHTIRIL